MRSAAIHCLWDDCLTEEHVEKITGDFAVICGQLIGKGKQATKTDGLSYSARKAATGSVREARRAGM